MVGLCLHTLENRTGITVERLAGAKHECTPIPAREDKVVINHYLGVVGYCGLHGNHSTLKANLILRRNPIYTNKQTKTYTNKPARACVGIHLL